MAGVPSPNLDLRTTEICNGRPEGDVTREDPGPFWTSETLRPIRTVLHRPCELALNWWTKFSRDRTGMAVRFAPP